MAKCFAPYGWAQDSGSSQDGSSPCPSLHRGPLLLPRPPFNGVPPAFGPSQVSSSSSGLGVAEARAAAASKTHCLAEKRRRERINTHLSTLRRMVPNSSKMDKASLLGKVIDQVKDLRRKATDVSKGFPVPQELNEVTVESNDDEALFIRASICCDDRSDLFSELIETFHGLRLRVVRADMASLGGRTRNVFVLCKDGDSGGSGSGSGSDVEAVRAALGRLVSMDTALVEVSAKRRRRLLEPHCS